MLSLLNYNKFKFEKCLKLSILLKVISLLSHFEVHLIGELKGAYGFDTNRLFCKFNVRVGYNWTLLSGKDNGETYEEIKDDTEEYIIWDHPFDLHYKTKTMRGWPKFMVEVW